MAKHLLGKEVTAAMNEKLQARVAAVSAAAAACGVAEGMTGRDALLLMERA